MSPLALGAAIGSPLVEGLSRAAGAGSAFLQSLLAADSTSSEPVAAGPPLPLSADPQIAQLQQAIAAELQQAGLADALPLEISDDGFGDIRVHSNHLERRRIERLLNDHPTIAAMFRALVESRPFDAERLRLVIPADGLNAWA